MNWYYVQHGKQAGPVDDFQLEQLDAEGRIQDETLVWHEGMPNWKPYRDVRVSAPPFMAAAEPPLISQLVPAVGINEAICAECRNAFPKENMIRHADAWVCANCKPLFMQKLAEGARLNTIKFELRYAGFWIRFVAKFIDGLILGFALGIPFFITMFILIGTRRGSHTVGADGSTPGEGLFAVNLFQIFFQFIYIAANALYAGFFVGKYGATPGKMACKLIVVDPTGGRISYGRSFGRAFAEILSQIICDIGYIVAAFDGEKRALHDHVCTTRVIYKE